ncbi:MAG: cell division protein, partial [Corynebacterium flavescens]|nr:cell division protein [Corynebacterium flavescens]
MSEQKQRGLGKGLAALIPSGNEAPSRRPRLGNSAADIILGNATSSKEASGEGKKVKGAPTISQSGGSS